MCKTTHSKPENTPLIRLFPFCTNLFIFIPLYRCKVANEADFNGVLVHSELQHKRYTITPGVGPQPDIGIFQPPDVTVNQVDTPTALQNCTISSRPANMLEHSGRDFSTSGSVYFSVKLPLTVVGRKSHWLVHSFRNIYWALTGEGNGNPLQYSCLENPMDWGSW